MSVSEVDINNKCIYRFLLANDKLLQFTKLLCVCRPRSVEQRLSKRRATDYSLAES